jgi:HEAT repeat protein
LAAIDRETSDRVRLDCVKVIAGMSPQAMARAVPTLGRTAASGSAFVESAAILLRNDVDFEPALPEVVTRMTGVSGRGYPERFLIRVGQPAVPHLITALRHEDPFVRACAAATLGHIGPDVASAAVPALIEALDDEDEDALVYAAAAVGELKAQPEMAVGPLIKLLDHKAYRVRAAAAITLGSFGPAAQEAVPRLEQLLETNTRNEAQEALSKIVPNEAKR